MTLSTEKQLADNIINAMYHYIGAGFMCGDQSGKTVEQVIREYDSQNYERTIGKIALRVLGSNLPGQKSKIRNLKFVP